MSYDDPDVRRAFIVGARAAYESLAFHVPPREQEALRSWLDRLADWKSGDPPFPPDPWKVLLP